MTLRRLAVLIRSLPPTASIWSIVRAEHEKANKPTVEQLRARQAHYKQREGAT